MARNSQHIVIHKPTYKTFMQVNFEEEFVEAYKVLSKSGLGLYMYLAKNKDLYDFDLSRKDFCSKFEVSETTYKNAKKELIAEGFLVPHINKDGTESADWFDFYTKPKNATVPELGKGQKIVPNEKEGDKKLSLEQTKNCPQKDKKLSKEQIIDNNKQIGANINTLSAPIGATSHVNITLQEPKEEGKEKALPITEAQLAQVINYEDCGNGKYFINGRYFYLQN